MSRKLCTDCQTRPANSNSPEGALCTPCEDYAYAENAHSDWGHDEVRTGDTGTMKIEDIDYVTKDMTTCPVCHPELDPRNVKPKAQRTGHKGTAPHSYSSHAACAHERTPKARETCRRARKANAASA